MLVVSLSAGMESPAADSDSLRREFFDSLSSFDEKRGAFAQELSDADETLLERTEGNFIIRKPYFRWQTTYPYSQIAVVSEKQVLIYEVDFNQLSEADLKDRNEENLLGLLLADSHKNFDGFRISKASGNDSRVFSLIDDNNLVQLEFAFSSGELASFSYKRSNQLISIEFLNVVSDQSIFDNEFDLDLPDDVEIVKN
jgi:outer membrane lipoprotein-sorting protein